MLFTQSIIRMVYLMDENSVIPDRLVSYFEVYNFLKVMCA